METSYPWLSRAPFGESNFSLLTFGNMLLLATLRSLQGINFQKYEFNSKYKQNDTQLNYIEPETITNKNSSYTINLINGCNFSQSENILKIINQKTNSVLPYMALWRL